MTSTLDVIAAAGPVDQLGERPPPGYPAWQRSVSTLSRTVGVAVQLWDLTASNIEAAHVGGLEVTPWTVNELNVTEHLSNLYADGFVADRPDLRTA